MFLFNESMIPRESDQFPLFQKGKETIFSKGPEVVAFIESMLAVDPAKRPTLEQARNFLCGLKKKCVPVKPMDTVAICAGLDIAPAMPAVAAVVDHAPKPVSVTERIQPRLALPARDHASVTR